MTARLQTLCYFCFFASGFSGLVYQVLWTRRLSLTFGHSVFAISTVLTAFMSGLALGSLLAGRATFKKPLLKVYGLLELFIGVWALLSLPLLDLVEKGYANLIGGGSTGPLQILACFMGAGLVLLPPTAAMGATLPIMARLLANLDQVGKTVSRLYGINTLGAVLGATCTGFLLLPTIGLIKSLLIAAALNILVGLATIGYPCFESKKGETHPETSHTGLRFLLCMTLSGAASMAFQVGWTRGLCLSIGSSVYAFSLVLTIFLAGIALGSLLFPLTFRNPKEPQLGWLFILIGLLGGAGYWALGKLPSLFAQLFEFATEGFPQMLATQAAMVVLILAPPTLLMGLSFPLAATLYSRVQGQVGKGVGDLYSANTLGCILGAFATGFLLVPFLGVQATLKIGAILYLLVALPFLSPKQRLLCPLVGVALLILPSWSTRDMSSGVAVYGQGVQHDSPPLVYIDGVSATVSLHRYGRYREKLTLRVNGKADASTGQGDGVTQHLVAYLPTLLHPDPKRVAVIGLGGGFTLEAAAQCPGVESIDCAELEPAVIALQDYWHPHNGEVLKDPRVRLHKADGRTFVLGTQQKFDVLISEPSNPWIAGIGNLFTQDFYQIAHGKMKEDGIFCQWFNLYAVSPTDVRRVLKSFFEVFEYGQVWQADDANLLLLGSRRPIELNYQRIQRRWANSPRIQRHFFEMRLYHPSVLTGHYLYDRKSALEVAGDIRPNTDDLPLLEYSAPLSLHRETLEENLQLLWSKAEPGEPSTSKILGLVNIGAYEMASDLAAQIQKRSPLTFLAGARNQKPEVARQMLEQGLQIEYNPLLGMRLGDLAIEQGDYKEAASHYGRALEAALPGSLYYLNLRVGLSLAESGLLTQSLPYFQQAAEIIPERSRALAHIGDVLIGLGRKEQARRFLEEALKRNPYDAYARDKLSTL